MATPLVVDIQRFSLHDGDGIRTTVFFKGCPLRCLWCHNPEAQRFGEEVMFYGDRCIGCDRCREGGPQACPSGAREVVGRAYGVEELFRLLVRDERMYEVSGGGVTFSGGEVMCQDMDYVCDLAGRLRRRGVSLYIDTCGSAPWERFERILPLADAFLYDFKAMDAQLHRRVTGLDNALILDNLRLLSGRGARINLRVPVIPGVNDGEQEQRAMMAFARECAGVFRVNLLPYHRLGSDKCERLQGRQAHEFRVPGSGEMDMLALRWREAGFTDVRIGG